MTGNLIYTVYVFNAIPQIISLAIYNEYVGAKMPGVTARPYNPYSIQITRSDINLGGVFVNGQPNPVSLRYQGGTTPPVNIDIPKEGESTPDLWLYLFNSSLMLFDASGRMLELVPITWSLQTTAKSEEAGQIELNESCE